MTCSFNLGGDKLYSVKWYKGRHEFYRFMPHEVPKVKIFPVKGMKINVSELLRTWYHRLLQTCKPSKMCFTNNRLTNVRVFFKVHGLKNFVEGLTRGHIF